MQTVQAGHAPLVGTTAAVSAFVWLLGLAYLYLELSFDERSMGPFVTILLVALGKFTASAVQGAKLSLYEGIGHAPFWEDAPRFNRELVEFVRLANK
jgi:pimeloyl-ACP methyl ester carboxylesterase